MEYHDIKVSKDTWNLIRVRVTELTVKKGELVTIKDYIKTLVEGDMKSREGKI